jgi:D-alanyl-D-alanine carboxypeptidase
VTPVRTLPTTIAIAAALCLLLALAATAGANPITVPVPRGGEAQVAKLQAEIDKIVEDRAGPPGIAVVLTDGKRQTFLSAGVANTKSGAAPKPTDHFRIASVAKAFNAYLAVKLAAKGEGFSLGETLGESIPGVLPQAEGVTVAQLLQHTSGLADYIGAEAFVEEVGKDPTAYLSPTQVTGFVKDDPLEFRPGSRYHYSDTDNIAAGLMEEAETGVPYGALLKEVAFGPLGMKSSSLPRTVRMPQPAIRGYDVDPPKPAVDETEVINPAGAWASGGILSTPADLGRFLPAYVPTVLAADRKLARPFRPGSSSPPGPGTNSAGIGIFRYRSKCGTVYGHTGSFPGYRVFIAANAAGTRGVVFVANAQIIPGAGSKSVSAALRASQVQAVCAALH